MKQAALKPFIPIGTRKRAAFVDVLYGEKVGDPRPFVLTVSPQYVSRKMTRPLPINTSQIQEYVTAHANKSLLYIATTLYNAGHTAHFL
jgi:hypothetical protein